MKIGSIFSLKRNVPHARWMENSEINNNMDAITKTWQKSSK